MSNSWRQQANGAVESEISCWWRDRVSSLIRDDRKKDAASLYLEFCLLENRVIELSVHPHQ